jgi:uncharacterized protein (TIGR00661 family)
MKILYAIQGTGNGHLSRARDIIPLLRKKGNVDVLISGCQVDMSLPFDVKYCFHGLSFIFGKNGGIDYFETYKRSNLKALFYEVSQLPVTDYDVVISDFEPVSAWACYIKNKTCIGLSHQLAVINKNAPRPAKADLIGKAVLKYYAPVTHKYGFHFHSYDKNIFTPVIRESIRNLVSENKGHYCVYLPAYGDAKIIRILACFPEVEWRVFSKHCKEEYTQDNIHVVPVQNELFIDSLSKSEGVLCGAGFETPAEALFLKKKLMVIPMKGQYEQQCNAAALKAMGVPVLKNLKLKQLKKIHAWLHDTVVNPIHFPNDTEAILDVVFSECMKDKKAPVLRDKSINSPSDFRQLVLKKIFNQLSVK